jgi:hypothetical protein
VLQNSTLKIGCIVNDVASVNIDAKLIRNDSRQRDPSKPASTADLADTIELANGCACEPFPAACVLGHSARRSPGRQWPQRRRRPAARHPPPAAAALPPSSPPPRRLQHHRRALCLV